MVNSLKDVSIYRGADVGSDHNLAISTIQLSLAALKRQKKQAKYDSAKLLEKDILECFDATIGGMFQALSELVEEATDIDEEWSNFTSAVNDAAKEHLGQLKRKQADWISPQSRVLIKKRKEIRASLDAKYRKKSEHH